MDSILRRAPAGVLVLSLSLLVACSAPPPPAVASLAVDAERTAIGRALDDLHDAAAHADEARYFAHYAPDAVFLGTDATERWDLAAFRAYAHPHFAAKKAWAFHAIRRAVVVDAASGIAWFDEDLATEKLGPARGSGVLVRRGGTWLVAQYNLALVVPNERFAEVHAVLESAPTVVSDERQEAVWARATAAVEKGDLDAADKELRALAVDLESRAVVDVGAIHLRSRLAWLWWARGDSDRALTELELSVAAATRSEVTGNMSVSIRNGQLRDRILLLREIADAKGGYRERAVDALAEARALRPRHGREASAHGEPASVAVVDAVFASRDRDPRGVIAAAKRAGLSDPALAKELVDGGRLSLVDLHFLAEALDGAGDRPGAERARALVRSNDFYRFDRALVLRRWATASGSR